MGSDILQIVFDLSCCAAPVAVNMDMNMVRALAVLAMVCSSGGGRGHRDPGEGPFGPLHRHLVDSVNSLREERAKIAFGLKGSPCVHVADGACIFS